MTTSNSNTVQSEWVNLKNIVKEYDISEKEINIILKSQKLTPAKIGNEKFLLKTEVTNNIVTFLVNSKTKNDNQKLIKFIRADLKKRRQEIMSELLLKQKGDDEIKKLLEQYNNHIEQLGKQYSTDAKILELLKKLGPAKD